MGAAINTNPALHQGIGAAFKPAPATPTRAPGRTSGPQGSPPGGGPSSGGPAFAEALKRASGAAQAPASATGATGAEPLRFSRHALERVQRRGIQLDQSTL